MNIHEGAVCFARCPLPAGPFDGGPHGGVQRMQRMQLCNTPPARRMHVQETDGRAEFGWCSALCRWSSEDSRGFARIGKAKSRTRYGFAAAGRRQTPAGAHSRVSPSHLPPATASHLPRPCCTTREVPYSTPSEREGHSSGTESLADCSFTTSPSSMVLEASMLLEHVPQPTYPTHCT